MFIDLARRGLLIAYFKKDSKNIQERLKKYSRKGRIITPQTEFDTTLSCCYSYNP